MLRLIAVIIGSALLRTGVDVVIGFPDMLGWMSLAHDFIAMVIGVVLWQTINQRRK